MKLIMLGVDWVKVDLWKEGATLENIRNLKGSSAWYTKKGYCSKQQLQVTTNQIYFMDNLFYERSGRGHKCLDCFR